MPIEEKTLSINKLMYYIEELFEMVESSKHDEDLLYEIGQFLKKNSKNQWKDFTGFDYLKEEENQKDNEE
ncbi:MAG: hypothetical protein ACFFG0_08010 [Candidatus Thorarchaeota archaeon]